MLLRDKFGIAAAALLMSGLGHAGEIDVEDASVTGSVEIDGQVFDFRLDVDDDGDFFLDEPMEFSVGEDVFTLESVFGNVDPVQTLGVAVVDFGAPSSFAISLSVPLIPPIPGPANYRVDISGSCSDGGTDGCGASPFMTAGALSEYFVNGFGTSIATLGPGYSDPNPIATYGPFTGTGMLDCTPLGGCTSFETLISFTGSGGGDAIAFTTRYEITPKPIPAPGSLLLIGAGLAGFAAARRRSE